MSEEQVDVSLQDINLSIENSDIIDASQDVDIIQSLEIVTEDEIIVGEITEEVKDLLEDISHDDEKLIDEPSSPSEGANKSLSKSRELKSLLALSKEANLDTNIAYKRKSVDPKALERNINDSTSDDALNKQPKPASTTKLDDPDYTCVLDDDYNKETKEKDKEVVKLGKRKTVDESGAGGAVFEDGKKIKIVSNSITTIMNEKKKDPFCWQCHHEEPTIFCETCPRSFHQRCLRQSVTQTTRFLCPECDTIMKAENLKERSPAMQGMSLVHLCGLLKFALKRMMEVAGCEPFIHPVSETEFPEYLMYIVQPMDLTCLEKNIKANIYGSTQAFESDAKWLVHNSIIFNSFQSKLTSVAKSLFKICKQEMSEIENCASCYLNANTKIKTWFIEVCPKPHLLVWAKLKGFPFWPAKAMRTNSSGMVDVRFFGAHDRAWVSYKDCFLYSLKDPNSNKQKRNDINESIKEVKIYIENLEKKYGKFCYAEYRVPFEPDQEMKQLRQMLPNCDPNFKPITRISRRLSVRSTKNGAVNPIKLDEPEKIETDPLAIEEYKLDPIEDNNYKKEDNSIVNNENTSNSSHDSFTSNGEESNLVSDEIATIVGAPQTAAGKVKIISIVGVENGCKRLTDNIVESNSSSNVLPKISDTDLANEKDMLGSKATESLPTALKRALEQKLNSDISTQQSDNTVSPNKSKISDILIKKLMTKLTEPDDHSGNTVELDCISMEVTPVIENSNDNISDVPSEVQEKIENVSDDKEKSGTDSTNSNQVAAVTLAKTVLPETVTTASITRNDLPSPNRSLVTDTNEKMDIDNEPLATSAGSNSDDVGKKHEPKKRIVDVEEKNKSADKLANNDEKKTEQPLAPVKISKKRRRSERESNKHPEDDDNLQKKTKTDLNIEISNTNVENSLSPKSILESRLSTSIELESGIVDEPSQENSVASSGAESDGNSITIKIEPLSDGDLSGAECNQSLPHTSSTLNNSEKENGEAKKSGFKIVDNLSKVIDEVATNFSQSHENEEVTITKIPKRKEIFIKPLSKLQQSPTIKQRARKTFPMPAQHNQIRNVYAVQNLKATPIKTIVPLQKKDYSKTQSPKIVAITSTTSNKPDNILYVKSSSAGPFLPNSSIIYTGSTASIINMVPKLLQTTARGEPGKELAESQNYIPQSGATLKTVNSVATVNSTTENPVNVNNVAVSTIPSLAPLTSTQTSITNSSPNILDELQALSSMVPEPLNKAISDLMFRLPPKLKPRPPGPLSVNFDEGLPSSAGNVTSKINSISHRLGDYFRGMLIELLQDVGRTNSPEAEIANLKLEIEQLKHKHSEELLEIKKNIGTVLKDVQKSIVDERNRVIEETRTTCEAECVKRVEEAKSKQWCANCSKEAQFYCCWNTSYCDYPCQQKHWVKHMSKCTQSMQNNQSSSSINNTAKSQQLLLRPTAPPKNFTKSIVGKPTKVLVNNRMQNNKNSFNFSGNHLTLVESTPGSFELLGNAGPISVGGKYITGIGKVKSASTSSLSGSTSVTGNTHKAVIISHTKPLSNSSPKPYLTSTISEIDSD